MKTFSLSILLSFITAMSFSQAQNPIEFDIRINKQVNTLHFIDHLSQWSPYTGGNAFHLYTSEFSMTAEDSLMLELYKINRETLGWEAEIRLFNWAYQDYDFSSIHDSVKYEYQALKLVVDYFSKKKNGQTSLSEILNDRFEKLDSLKADILSYSKELETTFTDMEPYLKLWKEELNFAQFPLYICYSHKEYSTHGGANGDGVYSEFDVISGDDFIETGFGILTHEITHKVTKVGEVVLNMIHADSIYPSAAVQFMEKHGLTAKELEEAFKSYDPQGFGNPEYRVFEEVYVYYVSPVLIHQYDDEKVAKKIEQFKTERQQEFARIWYGVSLFKKEMEKNELEKVNKQELIWKLIEIYYEQIYFPNYK